jgi:hypothetical protein
VYEGRYEALDAFVDDIEELRLPGAAPGVRMLTQQPHPVTEAWVGGQRLTIEVFAEQGLARFRLLPGEPQPPNTVGIAAALSVTLGAALGAATAKKERLLSGIALGVLVGGTIGAATPSDRALALRFDPISRSWRLYDGPLRAWAKKTLIPT